MIYSMWVDQERVESMCTPSNLYVVTLSMVCDAISGKGKLVLARRPSTKWWKTDIKLIVLQPIFPREMTRHGNKETKMQNSPMNWKII